MTKRSIDAPFLLVVSALVVCGLLIFTSAALGLLARSGGATFTSVAVSQLLLGLVCGGILFVFFSRLDYHRLQRVTPYLFGCAMLLTVLTFVPHIGLSLKGAARWIVIAGFSFQPEELLKFATVLFLSAWYATRLKMVPTLKGGIVPLFGIAGSAALLLILQPDTAGLVVLGMAAVTILFAAGGRLRHLGLLVILGVMAVALAAMVYPHVAGRINTFLHQGSDPQGSGWQIEQSLISVGSGGLTGRGFGQGIEKFSYLPEPIGDSIFAVAGEEFGFLGTVLLVLLFTAFCVLGFRIAVKASDPFGGLIVVGFTTLIAGQSFFNIASTIALVPLVGVPLIFVSHGGTALAFALAEVGILANVSRHMRK